MRPPSLIATMCLFSSLLAAQTTTTFRVTAESATALATVNGTRISIEVGRGNALGAPVSFLDIFTSTSNPDGSITFSIGIGTIPNEDFFTANLEQMSVNVDTSQVPGFQSTICTFSFTPFFQSTCSAGPLGVVQVNWKNNRITSRRLFVEAHETFGGSVTENAHEDQDQSSADADGSVLGFSFSAADRAFVIMNHDTTITVTR